MTKKYLIEIVLGLAIAFMALYPPTIGAILFSTALVLVGVLKVLEHHESPDVTKLKDEMKDLKVKVELLMLRGSR